MSKAFEMLERVKEIIRREPQNLEMSTWHCGTSHCIGGWLQILDGNQPNRLRVREDACRALGLLGPYAANCLFFTDHWPEVFQEMYMVAESAEELAEVACMAINDWMITNRIKPN